MDSIEILDLAVEAMIGLYPWEQQIKQKLKIDILIPFDLSRCDEDLSKSIDYSLLASEVTGFIQAKSFQLIEAVANETASFVKARYQVDKVRLCVEKPHALKGAGTVRVSVER